MKFLNERPPRISIAKWGNLSKMGHLFEASRNKTMKLLHIFHCQT